MCDNDATSDEAVWLTKAHTCQSPRAKLRALEVNQKNWDIDIQGFEVPEDVPFNDVSIPDPKDGNGQNNVVGFRAGDPELFKAMAIDEREAGNTTGTWRRR